MAESLNIANAALAHLGSTLITSLVATTKEARYCNLRIGYCRKELLRKHLWNFAVARKILTPTYLTITNAVTGAGGTWITVTGHGLATGAYVRVDQVLGTTEANGFWQITVQDVNTIILPVTFVTTYISGGRLLVVPAYGWDYRYLLPTDFIRMVPPDLREGNDYDYKIEGCYLLANDDSINLLYIYDCSDETLFDPLFSQCLALLLAWEICVILTQSEARRESLMKELHAALSNAKFVDATEDPAKVIQANDWTDAHMGFGASAFVRDPMTS